MRRILLLLCATAFSSLIQAQPYPENWLVVTWFINDNPGAHQSLAFGFDASASDSLGTNQGVPDVIWLTQIRGGEQLVPSDFSNDNVRCTGFLIGREYLADGSYVDIRRKPPQDSFVLTYEFSIRFLPATNSMTLTWDPQKIPSFVRSITLEPGGFGSPQKKTEMKTNYLLELPNRDSMSKYSKIIVTLYYNQKLSTGDNDQKAANQYSVMLHPNPMQEKSTVTVQAPRPGELHLGIYDVVGRKVLDRSLRVDAGENTFDLFRDELPAAGIYYLRVLTASGERVNTITKAFQVF